jgi:hypothetical protein
LAILALVIPYAWAVLWLMLLGHRPQTPMAPLRQALVRQWIHQWGRFVLFVSGFYHIPVRGWHNLRAAEESRQVDGVWRSVTVEISLCGFSAFYSDSLLHTIETVWR